MQLCLGKAVLLSLKNYSHF